MTKLIIDTDPGVDDAMAILFAGLCPEIELRALTSIFGNLDVDRATRNALVLCDKIDHTIPVARGAEQPLVQPPNPVSDFVHGSEGFGDLPAIHPNGSADPRPAHHLICDLIHENPGEITLCPIGPLTNIALALQHDPKITHKVKSVVLMGGALHVKGNVSAFAEANIWNDPHAADAVFAADWPVTMVGLDVTQKIQCHSADFAEMAQAAPDQGGFLQAASRFYLNFYKERHKTEGCSLHDPSAVIAAAFPHLFEVENHRLEVTVSGTEVGRTRISQDIARQPKQICTGVASDEVKRLFMDTIKSGS